MEPKVLIHCFLVGVAIGCNSSPGAPPAVVDAADVLSITLESSESKVVLSDAAAVKDLLALARFEPKPPCACDHFEGLTFQTRRGSLKATVCDHCFDLEDGSALKYYEMTPAFRARYLEILKQGGAGKGR